MLAVQRKRNFKQRLEPRYFRWDIHGLMSQSPRLLWVLAGSLFTRASANLSVEMTIFIKGSRISLLNFCEPWLEVFIWSVLRVPNWRRGDSVPASPGSRERWVVSHNWLCLGDISLAFWHIVTQPLVKIAQTGFLCKCSETWRVTEVNS